MTYVVTDCFPDEVSNVNFIIFIHSDQIYEQGRPDSPRSGIMSRYDMGPRTMFGQRGRPIDNRRNLKDCVEIEIDGQIKG